MSYSNDKKMINSIPEFKITERQTDFPTNDPEPIDSSLPIETLVEKIIEKQCDIHFKVFIKDDGEYNTAQGHALNSLYYYRTKNHHYIPVWISECLHCFDVILITYLRSLGRSIYNPRSGDIVERDLYSAYKSAEKEELNKIGKYMDTVYKRFRNPYTHRIVTINEKDTIKEYGAKEMRKSQQKSRDLFAATLLLLLPLISPLIEE